MSTLTVAQLMQTQTSCRFNAPTTVAALAAGVGVTPQILHGTYPPVDAPDLRLEESETGLRVSLPAADLQPSGVEVPHWYGVLVHCVRDAGTPHASGRQSFSLRAAAELLHDQEYRMGGSRTVAQLEEWLKQAIPGLHEQGPRLNERDMVVMG